MTRIWCATIRKRKRQEEAQPEPKTRAGLVAAYGQVWDTKELAKDFIVIGIERPLIVVKEG